VLKCQEYGIVVQYNNKYASNVFFVRNMCLGGDLLRGTKQKPFDGKLKYDYIMWIDSDIIFTLEQFFALLYQIESKSHIKVLSGLYLMGDNQHYATVRGLDVGYLKKHGSFEFINKTDDSVNNKDIFEVDYTGFGFLIMRSGVFEKFQYPWFSPIKIKIKDTQISDFSSEDVGFCLKLKSKDIPVCIFSRVIVKHQKLVCL
jgi:GT2 family glycosyltransferase